MSRYTVLLMQDPEDGGYTVTVPALPECITEGDTFEEAVANARDAATLYLDDAIANNEPVPEEPTVPLLAAIEV